MKVLVTGVKGQLGYDVMNELAKRGYEGVGVDVAEMDITDSAAVEKVISEVHPGFILQLTKLLNNEFVGKRSILRYALKAPAV